MVQPIIVAHETITAPYKFCYFVKPRQHMAKISPMYTKRVHANSYHGPTWEKRTLDSPYLSQMGPISTSLAGSGQCRYNIRIMSN